MDDLVQSQLKYVRTRASPASTATRSDAMSLRAWLSTIPPSMLASSPVASTVKTASKDLTSGAFVIYGAPELVGFSALSRGRALSCGGGGVGSAGVTSVGFVPEVSRGTSYQRGYAML